MVDRSGSAKTVMASSKETPCFLRLAAALAGSNSKLGTGQAYGVDHVGRCDLDYVAKGSRGCPIHDDETVMNGAPKFMSGPPATAFWGGCETWATRRYNFRIEGHPTRT